MVALFFFFELCFFSSPRLSLSSFFSVSPSPFGTMGSLWEGAVVVRGHPGGIPGLPVEVWILGYSGCCVLVAGKLCSQQPLFSFVLSFFILRINLYISYFASTREADSLEWYSYMLASS